MIFKNLVKGNENELSIILVKIGSAQDTATEEESFKVYKKYQGVYMYNQGSIQFNEFFYFSGYPQRQTRRNFNQVMDEVFKKKSFS